MTRKYTDTLKADIATALADNSTQQISAADVRQQLLDTIDSLRPSWAGLSAQHTSAPVTLNLTSTWQDVNAVGFWTAAAQSYIAELEALQTAGQVDVKFGDFNHVCRGSMNFEAPNGQEVQFSLGVNGATAGIISSVDGAGSGRIIAVSDFILTFPPIGAKISLLMRVPSGTAAIQVHQAQLFVELQTTRYP